MKAVIQRVKNAEVGVNGQVSGVIGKGLLVFLGITHDDTAEDVKWLVKKIVNQRIFHDEEGKMNLSVKDVDGEVLLVSQFTLHASVKKGNRPSFMEAAPPPVAIPLYNESIDEMSSALNKKTQTGEFGAEMEVKLVNDGPVTIIMDSKNKV